jgi:hypothetical protein
MEQEFKIPDGKRSRIAQAFLSALKGAVMPYNVDQLELFADEEDEHFVRQEVERLLYEPKLPNAGNQERRWIKKLTEFADDDSLVVAVTQMCREVASAFAGLLPRQEFIERRKERLTLPGCYYARKPITPKTASSRWKALIELRNEAIANKEWDKKWLADFLLAGVPEAVSNFRIDCVFLLRGQDGNVTRLVRLINVDGEVSEGRESGGTDILPSEQFASAEKFRAWCLSKGNFNWGVGGGAGNIELQMLHADVSKTAAYKVVKLVEWVGWYPLKGRIKNFESSHPVENGTLNGLWFYDDCAFAGGKLMLQDNEALSYEGQQYVLSRKGREADFTHGRPAMKPSVTIKGDEPWLKQFEHVDRVQLNRSEWTEESKALPDLAGFFRETCRRFYETAGGYGGWMSVGAVLGYIAGPEFFDRYKALPSIFMPGEMGSGKTEYANWLMGIPGYSYEVKGMGLGKGGRVTPVGLCQQLENYSSVPVWFDEFRQFEIETEKLSIIRDSYDRQLAGKWTPDGIQRVIRTTPLVSGETSTSDAATRSRFPHLQLSREQRLFCKPSGEAGVGSHLEWMRDHREYFFLFWRHLMENRARFVDLVMTQVRLWHTSEFTQSIHERTRLAHSLAYAAFMAGTVIFESHSAGETYKFRRYMIELATAAAGDVRSEVNVNVFIQHMISGVAAGEIDPMHYRLEPDDAPNPFPAQGEWNPANFRDKYGNVAPASVVLWMDASSVVLAVQAFLRARNLPLPLKQKDIQDQLSKHEFWAGARNKRFKYGTAWSWGIKLDRHPLGTLRIPDDEFQAALSSDRDFKELGANFTPAFRDGDPRKGPLYTIVDSVLRWSSKEGE